MTVVVNGMEVQGLLDSGCCQMLMRVSLAGPEIVALGTIYLQCIDGAMCPYPMKKLQLRVKDHNEEICVGAALNLVY